MGGASNSGSSQEYHYVLFGIQEDIQHPCKSGIYFEYDDQINGSLNQVQHIFVSDTMAKFVLNDATKIIVRNTVSVTEWQGFLRGIELVFGANKIRQRKRSG